MISLTSEYALRALSYLATQQEGTAILGRDLAKRTRVPANYLSKIMLSLRNVGIVDATRGSGGGYRLRKPARKICLIDVVEPLDGPRSRPECLLGEKKDCSDTNPCPAHQAWKKVREAYLQFLEETTLAQISEHVVQQITLPQRSPRKKRKP